MGLEVVLGRATLVVPALFYWGGLSWSGVWRGPGRPPEAQEV